MTDMPTPDPTTLSGDALFRALAEAAGWRIETYTRSNARLFDPSGTWVSAATTLDFLWDKAIRTISTTNALLAMVREHGLGVNMISAASGNTFVWFTPDQTPDKALVKGATPEEALARALLKMFQAEAAEKEEEG